MAVCVFQEITYQPPKQTWITHDFCSVTAELSIDAGTFFGNKRSEVEAFEGRFVARGCGLQTARKEDLIDQLIQFDDILPELNASMRFLAAFHEFHGHANARQRRAQFVRSVGKQRFLGGHQRRNARRCAIKTVAKVRHLVGALHAYPRG